MKRFTVRYQTKETEKMNDVNLVYRCIAQDKNDAAQLTIDLKNASKILSVHKDG